MLSLSCPSSSALRLCLFAALCFAIQRPALAQERGGDVRVSPNAAVSQTVGVAQVRITYGRPSARGRQIFGGLVPYDTVWRTGANEATTITFSADTAVEGAPLPAGTYGLFTIPGRASWTIIFNDVETQWGAFDYDAGDDVLRVQVQPEEAPFHEMMTFTFEAVTDSTAEVVLHWAETRVPFTVAFDTEALVERNAQQ